MELPNQDEQRPENDPKMKWLEPRNFLRVPQWRLNFKHVLDQVTYEGDHYTFFDLWLRNQVAVEINDRYYDPTRDLNTKAVENLKAVAEKAPCGRGEETIMDEAIRKTWKINPEHIKVSFNTKSRSLHVSSSDEENDDSDDIGGGLDGLLHVVKKKLGLTEIDVEAKLHNALVYEQGSFFKPHTDSEKEQGMFGTMAIQITKSRDFSGGSMIIEHKGEKSVIELSKYKTCASAWYADCPHEIQPVLSGSRLVLVYNLIQVCQDGESAVTSGLTDAPHDPTPYHDAMRPIIETWQAANTTIARSEREDGQAKHSYRALVYPLDHKYSMRGLSKTKANVGCYDEELKWNRSDEDSTVTLPAMPQSDKKEGTDDDTTQDVGSEDWVHTLKGRDRSVVRVLKQLGLLKVNVCVQDVVVSTSCESGYSSCCSTECKIMRDGQLVDSEFEPRGYDGTSLYVFSKSKSVKRWINQQLNLRTFHQGQILLDQIDGEPYTGNEGQDAYSWYRKAFLVIEPMEGNKEMESIGHKRQACST